MSRDYDKEYTALIEKISSKSEPDIIHRLAKLKIKFGDMPAIDDCQDFGCYDELDTELFNIIRDLRHIREEMGEIIDEARPKEELSDNDYSEGVLKGEISEVDDCGRVRRGE